MPTPTLLLLAALLAPQSPPAGTAATVVQAAPPTGLAVTFQPADPDRLAKEPPVTVPARLLALQVERGETPTAFLSPGAFRATFVGAVELPLRDRYRFRVLGKGDVELRVNGDKVLAGALQRGRPLDSGEVRLKKGRNELVCVFDSDPFGDGQLRLQWSTADFGFEPIAPERWLPLGEPAPLAAGAELRQGQALFVAHRCAHCHLPHHRPLAESADGELEQAGPDLRAVGGRLLPAWIAAQVTDPAAARPEARMPRLPLEGGSAGDVAAFLATLGAPRPEPAFTAEQAGRGEQAFLQLGCVACHVSPHQHPEQAALGSRLALHFVPRKWRGQALVDFLRAPRAAAPRTRMPDFRLSADEAQDLAAFLLRGRPAADPAPGGDADKGRRAVARSGCMRCHQLPGEDLYRCSELDQVVQKKQPAGCLSVPAGHVPDHHLQPADQAALRAFLPHAVTAPFRRAPLEAAERAQAWYRCTSCHAQDGQPSAWMRVVEAAAEPPPPSQDPQALGLPALTWAGAKLQPGWLQRFVAGELPSPRPWLPLRMPSFPDASRLLAQGLAAAHGLGTQDEPAVAGDAVLAADGARLVRMGEGFGCVQCHGAGDAPPVQVLERQGINFRVAAGRLRKDYYLRWLLDPTRIDPEAKMPKFAGPGGKTAFTDVLGGDAVRQYEAIWQYLHTLR